MKQSTAQSYRKRLVRVIDYIHQHLDQELDVNTLADVALMSPYHFHRIYREMAQENVNATVRRLRLQQAALELIRTNQPLATIATNLGYGSPEALSRAFTKQFGEAPGEYRNRQQQLVEQEPFVAMLPNTPKEYRVMYDVEIIDMPATALAAYEHEGDYMQIGNAFEKLTMHANSNDLLNEQTRWFGIYYHDPKTVPANELQSAACITVTDPVTEETDGPKNLSLPAGKCVTLTFKGPYAELEAPYNWLFGQWLPQSGYEAANFPPFEEYLNDPKTTPPTELLTRIHCVLAS